MQRICFSESICYAINSKPHQAWPIYYALNGGMPIGIYVYVIDVSTISSDAFMSLEEVFQMGVPDAKKWREYWLLPPPRMIKTCYYAVLDADFSVLSGDSEFMLLKRISLGQTLGAEYHFLENFVDKHPDLKSFNVEKLLEEFHDEMADLYNKLTAKQKKGQ